MVSFSILGSSRISTSLRGTPAGEDRTRQRRVAEEPHAWVKSHASSWRDTGLATYTKGRQSRRAATLAQEVRNSRMTPSPSASPNTPSRSLRTGFGPSDQVRILSPIVTPSFSPGSPSTAIRLVTKRTCVSLERGDQGTNGSEAGRTWTSTSRGSRRHQSRSRRA